jgi:hypothetical protein
MSRHEPTSEARFRAPFRSRPSAWDKPFTAGHFRELAGRAVRLPPLRPWPTCSNCGSVLAPAKRESRAIRDITGVTYEVEKFRCGFGRGREVRRLA